MMINRICEVLEVLLVQDLPVASWFLGTAKTLFDAVFGPVTATVAVSGEKSVLILAAPPVLSEIPIQIGLGNACFCLDLLQKIRPFGSLINLRFSGYDIPDQLPDPVTALLHSFREGILPDTFFVVDDCLQRAAIQGGEQLFSADAVRGIALQVVDINPPAAVLKIWRYIEHAADASALSVPQQLPHNGSKALRCFCIHRCIRHLMYSPVCLYGDRQGRSFCQDPV